MNIIDVHSSRDIETVANLAQEIWNEHFTPIIGQPQVNYMLKQFQSQSSIRKQIASGCLYLLVKQNSRNIGYAGLIPDNGKHTAQLSKFYLLKSVRGQGVGRELMHHIEELCQNRQITRIWLTVNRFNSGPIAAYRKMGFIQTDAVVQDIGAGYVMDDFIMEKRLSSAT
ncbi:MAG: GNAT family N-acetyltransferase [Mariprofundaceae bacterium]|nr:GNAT family N-acetyltransferase [Mariprofundaceae bacterium]